MIIPKCFGVNPDDTCMCILYNKCVAGKPWCFGEPNELCSSSHVETDEDCPWLKQCLYDISKQTKISDMCCDKLKKKPLVDYEKKAGELSLSEIKVIGTRAFEFMQIYDSSEESI